MRQPRQFSMVFPLARMKQGVELVGEKNERPNDFGEITVPGRLLSRPLW